MRRLLAFFVAALAVSAVVAPGAEASSRAGKRGIWVQIRRTEFGTPHIVARNYRSLGYGYGFAFAQDNLCTIAEDYVTVDGERSRWFGPGKLRAGGERGRHEQPAFGSVLPVDHRCGNRREAAAGRDKAAGTM